MNIAHRDIKPNNLMVNEDLTTIQMIDTGSAI